MTSFLLSNRSYYHLLPKLHINSQIVRTLYGANLGCRATLTKIKCSVDAPYEGKVPKFPRINVWDPHECLGISPYASEEEIWGSHNFLLDQYTGNERSEESIEAAFEKLLLTSFRERKKTKINQRTGLKKKVAESPPWIKSVLNFVELPPMEVIFQRLFLFAFLCGWNIMNSAEGGGLSGGSLFGSMHIFPRRRDKVPGPSISLWGNLGALATGWVCGSIFVLMIPAVLLQPSSTLELLTSLVAYLFLFLAFTFLK